MTHQLKPQSELKVEKSEALNVGIDCPSSPSTATSTSTTTDIPSSAGVACVSSTTGVAFPAGSRVSVTSVAGNDTVK